MNDKLVIKGKRPLKGAVQISGAKNSVLKLMAAAVLTDHAVEITNVPCLSDVEVMVKLLNHMGRATTFEQGKVSIAAGALTSVEAPYELVSKMRASFTILGALIGRYRQAKVSLPGGCSIGKRGVDLHVRGLQQLGVEIQINHGYVEAQANQLQGSQVVLDTPSVGATENVMLAAVLAEGSTVISNAAQEPEISDLANFLNQMGADIQGAGTSEIIINGVAPEALGPVKHHTVSDRIEAATYLLAAAATGGNITVFPVIPNHLSAFLSKLELMGCDITYPTPNHIALKAPKRLLAQDITTQPYPGFPTDLQAPVMAVLAIAEGVSIVTETIYENRFKQIGELKRMGAEIQPKGDVAIVTGVEELLGAPVKAHDLRAGAAMVIAGLAADGVTEIHKLHHLDRGYENLVDKLTQLGADIQRIQEDNSVSFETIVDVA